MKQFFSIITLVLSLLLPFSTEATTIKVGTLVSEGSTYGNELLAMAKEVKTATDGRVKFKFYMGGVAGDETDVLRKIHIGQLHGGVFSFKQLGDIYSDLRIMEIPYSFRDREHASRVLKSLTPEFEKGINEANFVPLGFYEVGKVYLCSKLALQNFDALRGKKIWLFEGDELVEKTMKMTNLTAVPVDISNLLPSLSTGLIDVVYMPIIGILVLQLQLEINYLIEPFFSFHFQGFVLCSDIWKKLSAEDQKIVKDISEKYRVKINAGNLEDETEGREALKQFDIKTMKWESSDNDILMNIGRELYKDWSKNAKSKDVIRIYENSLQH